MFEDGGTLEREINWLLEYYIGECLQYAPANMGDWWSDGVVCLEISQLGAEKFELIGVTWIGCDGIAPFEFIVQTDPTSDDYFVKSVFRIGTLDGWGRPIIFNHKIPASEIIGRRPRYNRDWAMAVELTPPEERGETTQD